MADGYNLLSTATVLQTCYRNTNPPAFSYANPTPSAYPDLYWLYNGNVWLGALTAGPWSNYNGGWGFPGRDIYVVRTTPNTQGNWGFWTDEIGQALMSQPDSSQKYNTGDAPLNLNQNWFVESRILPKSYLGCPAGGGPNSFTVPEN